MAYKKYSRTSSGWFISTDPEAPADKRWRAWHPDHGERFFRQHGEILPFTCQHMVEQLVAGPFGPTLRAMMKDPKKWK